MQSAFYWLKLSGALPQKMRRHPTSCIAFSPAESRDLQRQFVASWQGERSSFDVIVPITQLYIETLTLVIVMHSTTRRLIAHELSYSLLLLGCGGVGATAAGDNPSESASVVSFFDGIPTDAVAGSLAVLKTARFGDLQNLFSDGAASIPLSAQLVSLDRRYQTFGAYLAAGKPEALSGAGFYQALQSMTGGDKLAPSQATAVLANLAVVAMFQGVTSRDSGLGLVGASSSASMPCLTGSFRWALSDWVMNGQPAGANYVPRPDGEVASYTSERFPDEGFRYSGSVNSEESVQWVDELGGSVPVKPLEPMVRINSSKTNTRGICSTQGSSSWTSLNAAQKSAINKYMKLISTVNPLPEENRPEFYNMLQHALEQGE